MLSSTMAPAPTRLHEDAVAGRVPQSANDLIHALAGTPADDPGRPALRARVIEQWMPLARQLARRYRDRGEPIDDLVQTATLGLIKAVDRFDPTLGAYFAGFAIPTILGELRRHFRDQTWAVRVPRRTQELCLATMDATRTLTTTLGRSPTVADIAERLGISDDDVLEGLDAGRFYVAASLSQPATRDSDTELGATLGSDDHDLELAELRLALGSAVKVLDQRERTILALRFYGNLKQAEIGELVGISQMHVSRLIVQALAKLRTQFDAR
jgi:RNA polymerase sigma-B factor